MELAEFVHLENLKLYKRQLNETTSDGLRTQLMRLLTEEQRKVQEYPNSHAAAGLTTGSCYSY
jgi:hypothetical protein